MKKEAMFWKKIGENIQCGLCPHFCLIAEGKTGKCCTRRNVDGKLCTLTYNKPCSIAVDPIEKKPLYHFLPGEKTLSIATLGCNFFCKHCQNWEISQKEPDEKMLEITPEDIVKEAINKKLNIIAYTYTEPTIFYEYMLDIGKLARKEKIKNVSVTNGFINVEPLKELCKFLDASNIDIKGNGEFYERVCGGRLKEVLESCKILKNNKVWLEITYLIIEGLNDSNKEITEIVSWIEKNLGKEVPVHFTAFYPQHKMLNLERTSEAILEKARNIALSKGLKYVYAGKYQDTICPKCKQIVIRREGFKVIENKLRKGRCLCREKIAGIWD